jgi:hypothetical protein
MFRRVTAVSSVVVSTFYFVGAPGVASAGSLHGVVGKF